MIALPSDIDLNIHINNGVYFSMMDLGRFDLIFRTNLLRVLKKERIYPLVASQMIRYNKSIPLFAKFSVLTKVVGWDDKFFFLQQKFQMKNETVALAIVKTRFKQSKKGGISPSDFVRLCGENLKSPKIPDWILQWESNESDNWNKLPKTDITH